MQQPQQRNQVSADTHVVEYIPFDAGEHFLMVSSLQAHETVSAQRRPLRPRTKDSGMRVQRWCIRAMRHASQRSTAQPRERHWTRIGQYALRSGAGVAGVLPQPWNRMGQGECIDARHVSLCGDMRVVPWKVSLARLRLHHFALRLRGTAGMRAG